MKKLTYIFVTFLFFLSFSSQGQTIQNVVEKLDNYNLSNPQEKLYLQLDKYAYTAGETIWFKAYATIGISNFFSNLSGIAYVELINAAEQKVDSLIIPLGLGIGLGDIALSDTITEGSYRLRAYTNWMRNSSDKYFYDRTLQISNGRSDNVITSTQFKEGDKNYVYSINLKAISGVPLSNTSVRYEIINQGKIVERKRGSTDAQGTLNIDVAKKYNHAQISLHFTNVDKATVNKLIKVNNPEHLNHVELLPEGGKFLAGFINTVGIKSINSQGLGQRAKIIFTNGKDTLGNTTTNELGMGAFSFFLGPTDSLYAFAVMENGSKQVINTPKIYKSGYSLQVNNQRENKLYAQVNVSSDLLTGEDIYFLVHHLGKVLFVSKQKINKQELSFSVDKEELPSGVITISILNSRFEPLTERPIFSFNKADLLSLAVDLNKKVFGHRELVNVDLNILDNDSLKIAALSATVINVSKIKDNPYTAPNILSTLLLSADLNGYIEKPGYYFENNELKSYDIDYLMLTQGWRNIEWATLDLQTKPLFPAEKSLSISGYTKKLGRTKPEQGARVQMISTKNFMDFVDTTSNDDGYFNFDNLLFADSIKFLISAKDAKGKNNIDIVYERPVKPGISVNRNWSEEKWDVNKVYAEELNFSKKYFSELERGGLKEKAIQIEEVVVRANQKPKVSKNSRNLNGPGSADQIITADELSTCATLEMCLAGRLTGVTWQGGKPFNTRGNVPMQVVLDGMFIEPDQISMINVIDVESIEVLRNVNYTAIYGSNGAGGLIIITSKTGESAMRSYTPKGIITIEPQGAYVNRVFYKPKYDISKTVNNLLDLRTTIHWEPSIVTSPEGTASFNFYTADEKGKYLIVIEGLDLFGRICREVKEIEVK